MFSYVTLEQRVPVDHPLREIRALTDGVLQSLDGEFDKLYAATGRASIAPEYMLRALLLQAFYSIRSERASWSSNSTTTCCSAGSSA
jgi:transposase